MLEHLILVIAGAIVGLGGLGWFSVVRGGWTSLAGLFATGFLVVATLLILAGFGVIGFPGLEAS